jgi:hypothetical protein
VSESPVKRRQVNPRKGGVIKTPGNGGTLKLSPEKPVLIQRYDAGGWTALTGRSLGTEYRRQTTEDAALNEISA